MILAFLPVVVALAVHATTVTDHFVLDDEILRTKRTEIEVLDPQRVFFLNYLLPERVDRQYRPLTFSTYAINFRFGKGAWSFHLVNVLLDAAVALVAYLLLLELLRDAPAAAITATLYVVLPVRTEAVASILGRAEILSGLAILGAWLLSLRSFRTSPARSGRDESLWVVFAAGAVTLAGAFANVSAAGVIPLVIIAGTWLARRPIPWLTVASSACAVLGTLALRSVILEGKEVAISSIENPLHEAGGATRVLNGVRILGHYLAKVVAPIRLSTDYSFNQVPVLPVSSPLLWLAVLGVLGGFLGTVWFCRGRAPLVTVACVFFLVTMAPAANILFATRSIFAERLAYVPCLAFPLAIGALFHPGVLKGRWRAPLMVLSCVLIAAYGARAWTRTLDWRDAESMLTRLGRSSPGSARAHFQAAGAYFGLWQRASAPEERMKHLEDAWAEVREALRIQPRHALAEALQGQILQGLGKHAEAIEHFTQAERLLSEMDPPQSEPMFLRLRGESRFLLQKNAEALEDFDGYIKKLESLGRKPDALSFDRRGIARGQQGMLEEALADFNVAIEAKPDMPRFYNDRGFCRFRLNDSGGAIEDYRKGLELCRERGILFAASGESAWLFLRRIADVYTAMSRASRAAGNEAAAREATAQAAAHNAEAASLAPKERAPP